MKVRPRTFVVLCGFVPTIAAALLCLYRPALLANLEYSVYDVVMRAAPTRPPDARVAIIDIDERSLSAVGQWPWRRNVVSTLITKLRDLGSSVIALDIIFAESDRFQADGADTDDVLAATLREGHVILGYALTFDKVNTKASACVEHPLGLAIVRRDDDQGYGPFFKATGSICSLPVLTQAAGASGFLNAAPDPDGLLRRVPLLMELDGLVYPALSLASVLAATRARDVTLDIANVNTATLVVDERRVPLDGKSNLLAHYRGVKRTFPYFSAADVMSGAIPDGAFHDKLVFVGTTALGTREVVATPLDTLFAGVEVQATVADNLLQQDFIRRPEFGVTVETETALALGIAGILLVGRFGLLWGSISITLFGAAVWIAATSIFTRYGMSKRPSRPPNPPASAWLKLREEAAGCQRCDLYKNATQTVFGDGNQRAKIMLVGEQPGDAEDLAGKPFVGPAGQLLRAALAEARIDLADVYVTNVVKHFKWEPRGKRRIHKRPTHAETVACRAWLDAEIAYVKPQAIVALGSTAANAIIGPSAKVTRDRAKAFQSPLASLVTLTVHPSSILRAPDSDARAKARTDFVADLKSIAARVK